MSEKLIVEMDYLRSAVPLRCMKVQVIDSEANCIMQNAPCNQKLRVRYTQLNIKDIWNHAYTIKRKHRNHHPMSQAAMITDRFTVPPED